MKFCCQDLSKISQSAQPAPFLHFVTYLYSFNFKYMGTKEPSVQCFLAIYKNENLPNTIKNCQSSFNFCQILNKAV